jgi:hypothetical protein
MLGKGEKARIIVGKNFLFVRMCKQEHTAMTDKKAKTTKAQTKRPSRGYRKYLRRQKQAARKIIGAHD